MDDRGGAAEHVGAGDDGEEREAFGVAGEVGDEQPGVDDEPDDDEHGEHDVGDGGDDVQDCRRASRCSCCSAAMAMMPVAMTSAK